MNDEFSEIHKANLMNSLKSSLVLLLGLGLFILIVFFLINMITIWSQGFEVRDRVETVTTLEN